MNFYSQKSGSEGKQAGILPAFSTIVCSIACISLSYGIATAELPSRVDNSTTPYLRPLFKQGFGSCGEASGVGITFTYEINAARNLSANVPENQYPYCFTFHFLNDGGQSECENARDGCQVILENGIPNVSDFGGFANGYPTRWVSGYNVYYRGIHNRISDIFTFAVNTPEGLNRMKEWLYNHGDSSSTGGLLNFGVNTSEYVLQEIPPGTPQAGKSIVLQWGMFVGHSLTLVGYDDSVRYDVNLDGRYTNDIDITGDTIVDMKDWEIGAVYFINTWGTTFGDSGFAYMPYRNLAISVGVGGIKNDNTMYGMHVIPDYTPRLTCKVTLTHNSRSHLRIIPGVSPDVQSEVPSITKTYARQFNFAGGSFPMQGENMDSTIEIGIDISDFLDSLPRKAGRFFLQIISTGGTGQIDSFSLMDYTDSIITEVQCAEKKVPILPGDTTTVSIVWHDTITAINQVHTAPKAQSTPLTIVPNPVSVTSEGVDLYVYGKKIQHCIIHVCDPVGNSIYKSRVNRYLFTSGSGGMKKIFWNLQTDTGKKILPGSYLVIVDTYLSDGTLKRVKRILGVAGSD